MQNFLDYVPGIMINGRPEAAAMIMGGANTPDLKGEALFYPYRDGTIVLTVVGGLPGMNPHGYHIHNGAVCGSGEGPDPFSQTGPHFNTANTEHPFHAGDMPPLFGMNGFAYSVFYTNRFKPMDVVGRTVVIHKDPDDLKTQPSGNSGMKIACGEIKKTSEL